MIYVCCIIAIVIFIVTIMALLKKEKLGTPLVDRVAGLVVRQHPVRMAFSRRLLP